MECDGGPVHKKLVMAKDWGTLQRRIREVFDLTSRQMFHLTSVNLVGSHQDPCCVRFVCFGPHVNTVAHHWPTVPAERAEMELSSFVVWGNMGCMGGWVGATFCITNFDVQ